MDFVFSWLRSWEGYKNRCIIFWPLASCRDLMNFVFHNWYPARILSWEAILLEILVPSFLPTIWAVNDPRGVPALVLVPINPWPTPLVLVQLWWCAEHQVGAHPGALHGIHCTVCTPLRALWPGNWSGVFGCGILPLVALDPPTILERTIVYIVHSTFEWWG